MSKKHIANVVREKGLPAIPEDWSGLDVLLPLIELATNEGAVCVIKFDGKRATAEGRYSAIVSCEGLRTPLRGDADSIELALAQVLSSFARDIWGISVEH